MELKKLNPSIIVREKSTLFQKEKVLIFTLYSLNPNMQFIDQYR